MDVLYDFQSNRSQVKSAPVKSALVKSAPSQIGLKMKVKSTESKRYLLWKARGIYNLQTSDFRLRTSHFDLSLSVKRRLLHAIDQINLMKDIYTIGKKTCFVTKI